MTDVQILTLDLAVLAPISLLLLNNSRMTDQRTAVQNSVSEAKETLRAEMKTNHVEVLSRLTVMETRQASMEAFLHQAIMGKLDELDRKLHEK